MILTADDRAIVHRVIYDELCLGKIVETSRAEVTRVTVRFQYRVLRGDNVLCEGDTLLACVSHTLSPRRLPPEVVAIFASGEKPPAEWK